MSGAELCSFVIIEITTNVSQQDTVQQYLHDKNIRR